VIAKPLCHGDVRTVVGIFDGLGESSRRFRFNGPKPCLSRSELRRLATVDPDRQALVAYLEDDPRPIGIARFVRNGTSAEVAFAVVDAHQQHRIGTALASELFADARAAGITEMTALVDAGNAAALALLRRVANALIVRYEGSDLSIRAALTLAGQIGRTDPFRVRPRIPGGGGSPTTRTAGTGEFTRSARQGDPRSA
jgi:ribosomal protein S18 acetylase RimI-like enzyme